MQAIDLIALGNKRAKLQNSGGVAPAEPAVLGERDDLNPYADEVADLEASLGGGGMSMQQLLQVAQQRQGQPKKTPRKKAGLGYYTPVEDREAGEVAARAAQMPLRGMLSGAEGMLKLPSTAGMLANEYVIPEAVQPFTNALFAPSAKVAEGLSWAGDRIGDLRDWAFATPDTGLERILNTTGEWLLPMGKMSRADVWAAGAAGGAKEAARELGFGEGVQTGSEVGTGVLTALLTGRRPKQVFSSDNDLNHIAHFIRNHAHDPEKALENWRAAEANNIQGSLGQKTKDQGVFNAETLVLQDAGGGGQRIENLLQSRMAAANQIGDTVSGTSVDPMSGYPSPEAMRGELDTRFGGRVGELEQRVETGAQKRLPRAIAQAEANAPEPLAQAQAEAAAQQARTAAVGAETTAATAVRDAEQAGNVFTQQRTDMGNAPLRSEADAAFQQTVAAESKAAKQADVDPAWEAVKTADPVPSAPFKQAVNDALAVKDSAGNVVPRPADEVGLSSKYAKHLAKLKPDMIRPEVVKEVITDLGAEIETIRTQRGGTLDTQATRAAQVRAELIDFAEKSGLLPDYAFARKVTREHFKKFDREKMSTVRSRQVMEEAVDAAGGWTGNPGAAIAREAVESGNPNILAAAEDSLRSQVAERIRRLNPNSDDVLSQLNNINEDYRAALEAFPLLRSQLDSLIGAQNRYSQLRTGADTAVSGATAAGKSATKAEEAAGKAKTLAQSAAKKRVDDITKQLGARTGGLNKQIATRYRAFLDDPEKTLRKLLNSTAKSDQVELLKLAGFAKRSGADYAFNRVLRTELREMLSTGAKDIRTGGEKLFGVTTNPKTGKTATAQERFDRMVPALREGNILSETEVKQIHEALGRGGDNAALEAAAKKIDIDLSSEALDNLLASFIAMGVSPLIGSKQSLMINGAIRRVTRNFIREQRHSPEIINKLADVVSNPDQYKELIEAIFDEAGAAGQAHLDKVAARHLSRVMAPIRGASQGADQMNEE